MKKSLLALVALASLASSAAFAQSSVTLFGTVDATVRFVNNRSAGGQTSVTGDGNSNNKIGFKGEEDLGGGLKAGFHLENGFAIDTGKMVDSTRLFNRRSTLSLISADLGELRVGRDFTPTYLASTGYTAFGPYGLASINTLIDFYGTVDTRVRSDNQIAYFSPSISGFTANVSVAPGEGVDGRYTGGRVSYDSGAFSGTAAYGETRSVNTKFKQTTLAGSYDFGVVKALTSFTQGKQDANKSTVYSLGVQAPVGAAGQLRASYARVTAGGNNTSNVMAVGYLYSLSKRTALYSTAAFLKNGGGANRVLAAPANVVFGERSSGVEFGLRHNF